jgi:two-component system, NarL family, nitrate/nitrite response regulator NarL
MGTAFPERQREIRVLMLSPVRIYREGLGHVLGEEPGIRVVGSTPSLDEAVLLLRAAPADVVLLDAGVDRPLVALRRLGQQDGPRVVLFGVLGIEHQLLARAAAGVAHCVSSDGSVAELLQAVHAAAGDQPGQPAAAGARHRPQLPWQPRLTMREREIVQLIDQGLSNKEIAGLLGIQVATVKNHVHNILEKLGVRRRADAAATVRSGQALDAARVLAGARTRTWIPG